MDSSKVVNSVFFEFICGRRQKYREICKILYISGIWFYRSSNLQRLTDLECLRQTYFILLLHVGKKKMNHGKAVAQGMGRGISIQRERGGFIVYSTKELV